MTVLENAKDLVASMPSGDRLGITEVASALIEAVNHIESMKKEMEAVTYSPIYGVDGDPYDAALVKADTFLSKVKG